MSDLFLEATKQGLRFPSPVGSLTTEDLWSLPLTTTRSNAASIENIGADLLRKQAETSAGSVLVNVTTSPEKKKIDLMVDVIRKVAEVRQAENSAKVMARKKEDEKQRLLAAIADRELTELPLEELKKRVEEM